MDANRYISSARQRELNWLKNSTNKMNFYFGSTVGPLGILLNAFSAFVFFTNPKLNNKSNMGLLYGLIASADALTLFTVVIVFENLLPSLGVELTLHSDALCKLGTFVSRLVVHTSSWLQAFVAFERFMFISHPSRSGFLRHQHKVMRVLLAMLGVLSLLDSINLSYFVLRVEELDEDNRTVITASDCVASNTVTIIAENMYSLLRTIIPFILMAFFNTRIVLKIIRSRSRSFNETRTNSRGKREKKDALFTRAMLALNILFILSYFPSFLFYAYRNVRNSFFESNPSVLMITRDEFYLMIALIFAHTFQASTFFCNLYFNKFFRKEIQLAIRHRKLLRSSRTAVTSS
nr:G protein-coupled receptor [Proales similis]